VVLAIFCGGGTWGVKDEEKGREGYLNIELSLLGSGRRVIRVWNIELIWHVVWR